MLQNYEVATDSPDSLRKHGVVAYVNSEVKFNSFPCSLPNVVVNYLFDFEIHVVDMYMAPSYSSDLNESLMNFLIDICNELGGLPPDFQYQTFLRILKPLICTYVPSSPPGKCERVPWSTNPPSALAREHKNLWSQYKLCRRIYDRQSPITNSAWLRLLNTSKMVKNFASNVQESYERSLVDQLKSKLFQGYIKHKEGRASICRSYPDM